MNALRIAACLGLSARTCGRAVLVFKIGKAHVAADRVDGCRTSPCLRRLRWWWLQRLPSFVRTARVGDSTRGTTGRAGGARVAAFLGPEGVGLLLLLALLERSGIRFGGVTVVNVVGLVRIVRISV